MRNRNGDRRLSYPTRTYDAHEASRDELLRYGSNNFIPTNHPCQWRRHIPGQLAVGISFGGGRLRCRIRHRCDETITATGDIRNVPGAVLSVVQRLPQGTDLHAEICFIDRHVRPGARDQFVVTDDLAGTFYQGNQKIERAPAQRYRLVGPLELPTGHKQTERTKGNGFLW